MSALCAGSAGSVYICFTHLADSARKYESENLHKMKSLGQLWVQGFSLLRATPTCTRVLKYDSIIVKNINNSASFKSI